MAPINIEDHIREKMQERELQPSEGAWQRLEEKLGEEKRSGMNRTAWFAIAASFIGILILASVFVNSGNDGNKNLVVEDSSEIISPEIIETLPQPIVEKEELAVEEINSEAIEKRSPIQSEIEQPAPQIATINTPVIEKKEPVAVSDLEVKSRDALKNAALIDQDTFIKNKVDEVVAQVQNKVNANETVSAEEIDALLNQAQREISKRRILNSQSKKVDAAALLLDVEFELERGFRDRVFDMLGDGYKKIRTAVAERNY